MTLSRVSAFGESTREEQLAVLTELRRRSGDDANDVQTSIMVGAFGLLSVLFVAPNASAQLIKAGNSAWVAELSIGVASGVVIAIVLIPVVVFAVFRAAGRERATIWIRAYEDEIQRRWLLSGANARAWRRRH